MHTRALVGSHACSARPQPRSSPAYRIGAIDLGVALRELGLDLELARVDRLVQAAGEQVPVEAALHVLVRNHLRPLVAPLCRDAIVPQEGVLLSGGAISRARAHATQRTGRVAALDRQQAGAVVHMPMRQDARVDRLGRHLGQRALLGSPRRAAQVRAGSGPGDGARTRARTSRTSARWKLDASTMTGPSAVSTATTLANASMNARPGSRTSMPTVGKIDVTAT